jgi:two-component system response regulator
MPARIVLYVEDEDAAVFLLQTAITEAGIDLELHRVADGEQALAFLAHSRGYERAPEPDMVLLDLNLPKKSGLDVLAHIRHMEELRDIPVVVFTSSALATDKKRSLALGARDFITTPPTRHGLVAALKTACSGVDNAGA